MKTSGNIIAVVHWLQSHYQAYCVLGAVGTVLLGCSSAFFTVSLLVLSIICDHWIRTGKKRPVPTGTVLSQRDTREDSALLAEVAMHIMVSWPLLPLASLLKSKRRAGSAFFLAQTGQCRTQGLQVWTCLACATSRAGLVPDPVACEGCPVLP